MSDKVSQGAMELARKIYTHAQLTWFDSEPTQDEAAALIDRELVWIVRAAHRLEHNTGCPAKNKWTADASKECTCGLSALLAKWTVRG